MGISFSVYSLLVIELISIFCGLKKQNFGDISLSE